MISDMEADARTKKIVPGLKDLSTRWGKGDKIGASKNNNANN